MRQIQDQQYTQFTAKERINLTIAALARGDEAEADRLWKTCPRYKYDAHDFGYTLGVDALIVLGALFFQKCVLHYNLIKKADTFITGFEQDLEFEEAEGFNDLAKKMRDLIELATKAQNAHISKIKGLFNGFKQFCSSAGLDDENILKTIPIEECCHDLDILLGAEIEVDTQYMNHIKDFFLEHWHF